MQITWKLGKWRCGLNKLVIHWVDWEGMYTSCLYVFCGNSCDWEKVAKKWERSRLLRTMTTGNGNELCLLFAYAKHKSSERLPLIRCLLDLRFALMISSLVCYPQKPQLRRANTERTRQIWISIDPSDCLAGHSWSVSGLSVKVHQIFIISSDSSHSDLTWIDYWYHLFLILAGPRSQLPQNGASNDDSSLNGVWSKWWNGLNGSRMIHDENGEMLLFRSSQLPAAGKTNGAAEPGPIVPSQDKLSFYSPASGGLNSSTMPTLPSVPVVSHGVGDAALARSPSPASSSILASIGQSADGRSGGLAAASAISPPPPPPPSLGTSFLSPTAFRHQPGAFLPVHHHMYSTLGLFPFSHFPFPNLHQYYPFSHFASSSSPQTAALDSNQTFFASINSCKAIDRFIKGGENCKKGHQNGENGSIVLSNGNGTNSNSPNESVKDLEEFVSMVSNVDSKNKSNSSPPALPSEKEKDLQKGIEEKVQCTNSELN